MFICFTFSKVRDNHILSQTNRIQISKVCNSEQVNLEAKQNIPENPNQFYVHNNAVNSTLVY